MSNKGRRELFPDVLDKANGPHFIQQQSQVRLGAILTCTRKQEVCGCIQMCWHSHPDSGSCCKGLTLRAPPMTSSKVRKNCAGARKDASRRRSNHRQKGQQPKTEVKRVTELILTREKRLFYRKPLSHNATGGAMVQA